MTPPAPAAAAETPGTEPSTFRSTPPTVAALPDAASPASPPSITPAPNLPHGGGPAPVPVEDPPARPTSPVASSSAAPPADGQGGCTAAQLRRFVKSRAYVPLHELRRRFDLPGSEDDVNPVTVDGRRLFVGLPRREATLLGELLGAGDVGCELLLDPVTPLIVGVFPMRPVPRG